VFSVTFLPDGKHIVSGSEDHTICLWDPQTGQLSILSLWHTGCFTSTAFSPDGSQIVSASFDNTVRIWDLNTHFQIGPPLLENDIKDVIFVGFSPDGNYIVTASLNGTVLIWDAKT
jgi:WD40 repeat protein